MKLLELRLAGFGRLVDRTFAFAPGLNLIYGPNEAGKSTLQRAIMALLYGFFDDGRISQEHRAVLAANKPWDAKAQFAGMLIYALDDGRRFEVKRVFAPRSQTTIAALPDTSDISSQFRSASDGRLFFAEAHLGMSRSVFDNVCSVRQAELAALESSAVGSITTTIMRLSAAGSSDTTTDQALAALEKAVRDDVGSSRAWTKPLAQTTQRLADLEKARSAALRERDDLLTQIGSLHQAEEEVRQLASERQKLAYLQALAERDALREQDTAIERAAQEAQQRAAEVARWAQWAEFPAHLRDEILLLEGQRKRLQDEYRQVERRAVEAEQALVPIRADIAGCEARISALADARHVPDDQLPAVSELAVQWQRAAESQVRAADRLQAAEAALVQANDKLAQLQAGIQPILALGRSGLSRLQQQLASAGQRLVQAEANLQQAQTRWGAAGMSEDQFLSLERKAQEIRSGVRPAPLPRRGCNPFRSAKHVPDQAPTELVLYDQIRVIHDEVAQQQAELVDAQQTAAKEEADARRLIGLSEDVPLDRPTFEQLGTRLDEHLQAQAVVNQHRSTADEAQLQAKSAEEAHRAVTEVVQGRLAALGFAAPQPEQALATFREQCQRKQQLVREEAALERLQLRAQSLQREEEQRQRQAAAITTTESQLRELLLQAGIECVQSDLAEWVSRFHTGCENHARWERAVAAHEEASRHHRTLAETRERGGVDTRLTELNELVAESRSQHPEWATLKPERPEQEYLALQRRVEQAYADAHDRYRRLKGAIENATATLRHPAEIEEGIAVLRGELGRLEWYRDTLKLAYDELGEAKQQYQQQFAPRLERLMSDGLSRISDSRYTEVAIDPSTLAVSLKAPELHELVSVANLSTGTRDLVYLMLRIAIARLLSHSGEKLPLMMDDPLVQFDRNRQGRALEFLSQLAADTQVFLFTKDEWTRELFCRHPGVANAHVLHSLGSLSE